MNICDSSSTNGVSSGDDETIGVLPQSDLSDYKIKVVLAQPEKMENSVYGEVLNHKTTTKNILFSNVGIKNKIENIERTITNSHPLMLSPTSTDSDTEEFMLKNANFPDVIPLSEHQLETVANISAATKKSTMILLMTKQQPQPHNKLALLRTQSPDLLSSESEADISPYHAAVEVNNQTVALLSKHHNHNNNNNAQS